MNFTREPIIETIITPKDGNRLVVRNSKSKEQEEYSVEAVEVVSFGQALFFRSIERPYCFLVPVGDYEVIEVKESRMVLKNAQFEKTIKIGGGREASIRKEFKQEEDNTEEFASELQEEEDENTNDFDRKRERGGRRNRRRRGGEERRERPQEDSSLNEENSPLQENASRPVQEGSQSSAVIFNSLIPPPTTLISDSIKRYKEMIGLDTPAPSEKIVEKEGVFEEEEEIQSENRESKEEDKGEPTHFSRTTTEGIEVTTNFSKIKDWFNFFP